MSYLNSSVTNITDNVQYLGLFEKVMITALTTAPCCVFLYINFIMLFTLRSKTVFCETSRYVLLFNLLFADTVMIVLSQLMFVLAAFRLRLTYSVCGVFNMVTILVEEIFPLTLAVMSLERCVAVCFPLRHASIITIRNTGLAIVVVWAFSGTRVLTRVIFVSQFPFDDPDIAQRKYLCSSRVMMLVPVSEHYDKAYICFVFLSAGLAITFSYIGVMVAARSASTDKASVSKTRNTLLLHLLQLCLGLSSTILSPLITAISKSAKRLVIIRFHTVFYVCLFIFPRCLSSLIYGIRDQAIRPILISHLVCRLKVWNKKAEK